MISKGKCLDRILRPFLCLEITIVCHSSRLMAETPVGKHETTFKVHKASTSNYKIKYFPVTVQKSQVQKRPKADWDAQGSCSELRMFQVEHMVAISHEYPCHPSFMTTPWLMPSLNVYTDTKTSIFG